MLEATWQVFVLCCIVGLFLMWVMTLKKQIISLMEENGKLKKAMREKVAAEVGGTKIREGEATWGRKRS
jgi:hypothetical protein